MKKILLYALFCVVICIGSLFVGFRAGISSAAGSNVSQLYAGSLELWRVNHLIHTQQYEQASLMICRSLRTRLSILEMAKPLMGSRRGNEVEAFKQLALRQNIENTGFSLVEYCGNDTLIENVENG